jgi:hypothetical protein
MDQGARQEPRSNPKQRQEKDLRLVILRLVEKGDIRGYERAPVEEMEREN